VLRRPPQHLRPASNDVLRREARVLAALASTDVPHPRFVAACLDETVMGGAVFYLMEPVDGFNPATGLPPLHAGDAAVRHAMGLAAADALARLHRVDHRAVGLADFGKPEGFLERQVPRWLRELESYARHEGYPGPEIPGLDRVAAWLDRHRPAAWTPGILHGDYHLANVMYAHDGPRLAAIVDWEMCTIGDPLMDFGATLAYWVEAGDDDSLTSFVAGPTNLPGSPTRRDLIDRYTERTGRDLSNILFYYCFGLFKLAVIIQQIYYRYAQGHTRDPRFAQLNAVVANLGRAAVGAIAKDRVS
jgi:aminoglycoside phosphotransferase (APT) family kinase protein